MNRSQPTTSACVNRDSVRDIVAQPFTVALIGFKARQLCQRTDFSRSDFDELCQGMLLYLVQKAHLFDAQRGNLEAFVTHALKTWVAMELRYRKRGKRCETYKAVSLEGTPVECEGDVTCLGAVLLEEDGYRRTQVHPVSPTEQFELREAIEHVMGRLDPKDQVLVARVVANGITATAKELGVSWRQVASALARIRGDFEKAGLGAN